MENRINKTFILKTKTIYIILFCLFYLNQFANNNSKKTDDNNSLNLIKICKWKNDARTCVNFSFDDGCRTSKQISEIFDLYGYKCTFFVITNSLDIDSCLHIIKHGHEIGNHTYSHANLASIDTGQVEFQIRKGNEQIEKKLGVKCVSLAEPFTELNDFVLSKIFKYNLFNRSRSEYPTIKHVFLPLYFFNNINNLMEKIKTGIKSGNILQIAGHGLNDDGWKPVSTEYLKEVLDSITYFAKKGDVWVSTVKDGIFYENLYHEVKLSTKFKNDTLTINCLNYNRNKYKDLASAPISIEIPYVICNNITCVSDSVLTTKKIDKYIFTVDLKKDTSYIFVFNDLNKIPNLLNKISIENKFIYPNPATNEINVRYVGDIKKVQIFNSKGILVLSSIYNSSKLDISSLKPGNYILKVHILSNNTTSIKSQNFYKIK